MKLTWITTLVTTLTITTAYDPYTPGPHPTKHTHISALVTTGLQEELDIWTPTDPGLYPTLYLIDGFGGFIPANAYNDLSHHIASHGFSVVAPWSITLPLNPVDKVPIFDSVLTWAEEHLEEKLHAKGLDEGVHLDLNNTVLSGHSAGAHVMVEYFKIGCGNIRAQVLFSPVDGVDPIGLIPEFCITPGEYLNFGLPTLHLMVGFDNVPAPSGFPCAPDDLCN
ncbi:uncharacterized protein LOC126995274 [Eriocheir sinensis]|uniref:uncharacterized protein LOC126994046 n=1 Tax=Eriocheir sinensis TaxID=95602 RepID=UPI0021C7F988|nr:uncharacterized protein LOC126994046 [Eriocheir sinensis]XP_050710720.1 uncharacterized protein LOC126995274 [Eriocheir sinensis]